LPFQQTDLLQRGHAIECRIYAEDPANGFLPEVGTLSRLVEPVGPGVRVDSGVAAGDEVTLHYDPMLAKLIVLGESRPDALQKMAWALKHYIMLGVTTNIPFLQAVIDHPAFQRGETTTHFVERHFDGWQPASPIPPDLAFIAAALSDMLEAPQAARQWMGIGPADGDLYSPWVRLDAFRIGATRE
jgi:acetyl/propionyl-CoA carboxylase alpha subunit